MSLLAGRLRQTPTPDAAATLQRRRSSSQPPERPPDARAAAMKVAAGPCLPALSFSPLPLSQSSAAAGADSGRRRLDPPSGLLGPPPRPPNLRSGGIVWSAGASADLCCNSAWGALLPRCKVVRSALAMSGVAGGVGARGHGLLQRPDCTGLAGPHRCAADGACPGSGRRSTMVGPGGCGALLAGASALVDSTSVDVSGSAVARPMVACWWLLVMSWWHGWWRPGDGSSSSAVLCQ